MRKLLLVVVAALAAVVVALASAQSASAAGMYFDWISRDYNGGELNELSNGAHMVDQGISADGRYVLFASMATDVVPNDTNGHMDLFVRDRHTQTTTMVSVGSDEQQGNGDSLPGYAALSGDGRYVMFSTQATNFAPTDYNNGLDVFVRDLQTGTTTRVCGGQHSGHDCAGASISDDGNYITFRLTNPFNYGGYGQIYRWERQTGAVELASQSAQGDAGNASSHHESKVSGNGRYVVFNSAATNLVADDTNGKNDIFRRDMQTGDVVRISTASNNTQASDHSSSPAVSDDGRYVTFVSAATNLAPGNTDNESDLFIKDVDTGSLQVVAGTINKAHGSVTGNGQKVILQTSMSLVAADTDTATDAYSWDRTANTITRLSQKSDGSSLGVYGVRPGHASTDGQYVLLSTNNTIAPGDTQPAQDVYVYIKDTVKPVVTFTSPASFAGPFTAGPLVTVSASDPGSGLKSLVIHVYTSANQLLGTCGSATPAQLSAGSMSCDLSSLPDGTYYIKAGSFDNADNNRTINSGNFVISH